MVLAFPKCTLKCSDSRISIWQKVYLFKDVQRSVTDFAWYRLRFGTCQCLALKLEPLFTLHIDNSS